MSDAPTPRLRVAIPRSARNENQCADVFGRLKPRPSPSPSPSAPAPALLRRPPSSAHALMNAVIELAHYPQFQIALSFASLRPLPTTTASAANFSSTSASGCADRPCSFSVAGECPPSVAVRFTITRCSAGKAFSISGYGFTCRDFLHLELTGVTLGNRRRNHVGQRMVGRLFSSYCGSQWLGSERISAAVPAEMYCNSSPPGSGSFD